jgi:Cu/Ag efflux protein CusF
MHSRIIFYHDDIKGFMPAMKMTSPVKKPRLLHGLKAGDKILFTIDPEKKVIVGRKRLFEGIGKVIKLVPDKGQIVLFHGEIKGFMPAMTMDYRVKEASLLRGLNPGDKIHFAIEAEEKVIVDVEKVKD